MTKKKKIGLILVALLVYLLRPLSLDFLDVPYSNIVYDDEGALLSAHIATDEQWRFPIVNEIPEVFQKSIITFEDKRFDYHFGIDPFAIGRAVKDNIAAKRVVSGASTLTMQLARLVNKSKERTFWNKIKEATFALRLELWYSKKEILNWYASLAPFGGNVVGLEAACWRYFEKTLNQLTWAEGATLAVLPNTPSLIHVNRNRAALASKRNKLLHTLHEEGYFDSSSLDAFLAEPLPDRIFALPNRAPHYLVHTHKEEGHINRSKINRVLQEATHDLLNQFYTEWFQGGIHNAGLVILDTKSGEVFAYHGNIPKTKEEHAVDMVQAKRSSGSILKPFLFGHLLDEGLMSPQSLQWDIPTYISGFNPSNYNKTYSGAVPADEALQRSLNVPAVRQLRTYGIEKFLIKLKEHGLTTLNQSSDHYGLSLILGGGEVTLLELTLAYQKMGASLLTTDALSPLSKATVFQILETLKGLSRPNEEGNWERMDSRAPIAWKTGTSYGHRDAWAIGVTPEVTIGTWVGNADGEGRDGVVGTSTAGRLLFASLGIMNLNNQWFEPPLEEMLHLNMCAASGRLASRHCLEVTAQLHGKSIEKSDVCDLHQTFYTDIERQYRYSPSCAGDKELLLSPFLNLPPVVNKYYKLSHPEYEVVPALHPECTLTLDEQQMDFMYPLQHDIVYLPKDLNSDQQKMIAKIAHKQNDATIFWYLNEDYIGATNDFHAMAILADQGKHTITAVDQSGYKLSRNFEILREKN